MLKTLLRRMGFFLVVATGFMITMLAVFTAFYHYAEGLSWLDAFYFTVITTRTIGFGDISPTTTVGKIGTILNALLPATVFLGASLILLETLMRQLEEFWRDHQMQQNTGHDIIVSDVERLESILKEYAATKEKFVVIAREKFEDLPGALQSLLDHSNFLEGDATRDEVLGRAGVKKADTILIATGDDSFNLYVLVSARSLNASLNKIVMINHAENASKFVAAGADSVLPAATIVGQMLSHASLHPCSFRFLLSLHTHTQDPFLEDVRPADADVGKGVKDVCGGAVAVYREGAFVFDVAAEKIRKGDVIINVKFKYT
jgi:voltage-gated potassium channel